MKNIALLLLGLFLALPQFAQERKYSTFYEQRATLFEELPVTSRDIIFLGNSITNGCEFPKHLCEKQGNQWRYLYGSIRSS